MEREGGEEAEEDEELETQKAQGGFEGICDVHVWCDGMLPPQNRLVSPGCRFGI